MRFLLEHGVTPILVFDGQPLPMKKKTEDLRKANRSRARAIGHRLYDIGEKEAAQGKYREGIEITREMVRRFV